MTTTDPRTVPTTKLEPTTELPIDDDDEQIDIEETPQTDERVRNPPRILTKEKEIAVIIGILLVGTAVITVCFVILMIILPRRESKTFI